MTTKSTNAHTTLRLSDTHDQWQRRVHVNVRNGKPTMVYRWKSQDGRDHTQRMTLSDEQVARLMNALVKATSVAVGDDKARALKIAAIVASE